MTGRDIKHQDIKATEGADGKLSWKEVRLCIQKSFKEGKKITIKDGFHAIKTLFKYKF